MNGWYACLAKIHPPIRSRAAAILDIMQPVWIRCLTLGLNVVLDYGFWSRAERDHVRAVVENTGAAHLLWAVNCSDDEARKRIAFRNRSADRSLHITAGTFDLLKARLEPLGPDEPYRVP